MNRVIKFRCYDTELNVWVNNLGMKSNNILADGSERRFKIMQFTGLADKNGCEIYEGDIVKMFGAFYSVEYIDKYALFCICRPKGNIASYPFLDSEKCEVVGNIYDAVTNQPPASTEHAS